MKKCDPITNKIQRENEKEKLQPITINSIDDLVKIFSDLTTTKFTEKEKTLDNSKDIIDEVVKLFSDNSKQEFTFTQDEKGTLCNIILESLKKKKAREYMESYEYLIPKLINIIEQIIMMIPSPEP